MSRRTFAVLAPLMLAAAGTACAACGSTNIAARDATRTPLAEQWLTRAKTAYRAGDFDDARDAAKRALDAAPRDPEIRVLNGRIALARLDFAQALKVTEALDSPEAHGIRGRAHWYSGDVEQAADDFDAMLRDPAVKDPWARDILRLAHLGGGRHPFQMEGGVVVRVEMPPNIGDIPLGSALVVPCELQGDQILALVATGVSEVLVDSNTRHEPAWVNLRFQDKFGGSIEVKDVPALTQDLAPISHALGVPIKAMLGVNMLRHLHVTFDRRGGQFVVRKQDAPPPPEGSRVPLWYVRGGGMTLRVNLNVKGDGETPLFVDTARFVPSTPQLLPIALDDNAWKRAGIDVKTLKQVNGMPNLKTGELPTFRLGGFDLAKMPALEGIDMSELQASADIDVAGVIGAELMSLFRVTFADEGRFIWIEPDPLLLGPVPGRRPPQTPPPMQPDPTPPPPPPHVPTAEETAAGVSFDHEKIGLGMNDRVGQRFVKVMFDVTAIAKQLPITSIFVKASCDVGGRKLVDTSMDAQISKVNAGEMKTFEFTPFVGHPLAAVPGKCEIVVSVGKNERAAAPVRTFCWAAGQVTPGACAP